MINHHYLYSQLVHFAERNPDKNCFIETHTNRTVTYRELIVALHMFQASFGHSPKTILVALPGGIIDSIWWLYCLTSGHTIIPVSPHLTTPEYKDLLNSHTIDLIVTDHKEIIPSGNIPIISMDACNDLIKTKDIYNKIYQPNDGFVLLYTSGSTGNPKGIILSTHQITLTAQNIIESHMLTANDCGLTPLPFYHVNAPVVSLVTTVLSGGSLVIAPKFSLSNFWKWVETYDPTWISLVPTIITLLLTTKKPAFLNKSSLKFIRTASAPLPAITLTKFEEQFSIPVIETYGISEAASTITANPVPPGIHKAGSVGLPIGVDLCIADTSEKSKKLKKLPYGKTGEICVKGENVINSYKNNSGEDSFRDGWFCTGDLGYIDEDGYVFITGRKKDVINRGGEIIAPREIEDVLLTFPGIQEAIVVGHPDPIYGEKVVAMIKTNNSHISEQEIITYASTQLSPQKVPTNIYLLQEFPKGRTGKIDRKVLRDVQQISSYSLNSVQ